MSVRLMVGANEAYVSSRAKSRRKQLADRVRLRQLIHQSPDQLTVAVADIGYRSEIDQYAGLMTGSDLVEAALTQNLQKELASITSLCSGNMLNLVQAYSMRHTYSNAKVVLRAVMNEVSQEKIANSILPEQNELNVPWLQMIEASSSLREAAEQLRKLPFGKALTSLPEDSSLEAYEDALDKHYFASALKQVEKGSGPATQLRVLIQCEIDNRNIVNLLEASAVGLRKELIQDRLIPGGRLLPKSRLASAATADRDGLLDLLRQDSRFDMAGFEESIALSDDNNTLDPVMIWLKEREMAAMRRMSYLHPVSALPVIHYIAAKVQEVADLRLIVRGRLAGLPTEVLEAHIL